jgi:acylphosphatase
MRSVQLIITGKVQGVFYRASARRKANELGITGWIKNNKDGNVEVIASGDDTQIEKFINWCKQGPDNAVVERVIVKEKENLHFKDFTIVR